MTIHELSHYLRTQGIAVLSVISRGRQREGNVVEVGDIELGNNLKIEASEEGVYQLAWWMPDDNQRVQIGEFESAQVDELVKAIRQARR
jgi:hypothetical protein